MIHEITVDKNFKVQIDIPDKLTVIQFEAICAKAKKMFALSDSHPLVVPDRTVYKRWDKKELSFVKKNIKTMTVSEMAKELNRNYGQVSGMVWRINHEKG